MKRRRASEPAARTAPSGPLPGDAELMARLASGDIGALGELYDRYSDPLRGFVTRATGGSSDVDDLVHEAFLAAAKSASRYDGRASCRPWLVGITVQLLRRRRQTVARLFAFLSAFQGAHAKALDPRSALQAGADVERALRKLGEAPRLAFLLAEVEGFTCPEIAAMLEIPVGTVWTRLHAARRDLRRALAERPEEDGTP